VILPLRHPVSVNDKDMEKRLPSSFGRSITSITIDASGRSIKPGQAAIAPLQEDRSRRAGPNWPNLASMRLPLGA
jgi:hypothetical protein